MQFDNLILEKKDKIAVITINRAKFLNSLNRETLQELNESLEEIIKDIEIDVLIITGKGKAFIAGADISEMKDMSAIEAQRFALLGQSIFRKIELMKKPVIAAVNGYALGGGCELAMSCDIRIASMEAKFGQPEVTLGVTPGFAGTQRLPRLIGRTKANELIFTGSIINAQEAERIGLVNKVVSVEELMNESLALAKKIASNGQLAVRFCKAAINMGIDIDIERGMTYEAEVFGLCFNTHDQKEGMTAFIERRKPKFLGK